MSVLESITELLKACVWPLFFFALIFRFQDYMLKAFTFFGDLIAVRGFSGKYGKSEVMIPPGDPDIAKQNIAKKVRDEIFSSSSSIPSESSSSSS